MSDEMGLFVTKGKVCDAFHTVSSFSVFDVI